MLRSMLEPRCIDYRPNHLHGAHTRGNHKPKSAKSCDFAMHYKQSAASSINVKCRTFQNDHCHRDHVTCVREAQPFIWHSFTGLKDGTDQAYKIVRMHASWGVLAPDTCIAWPNRLITCLNNLPGYVSSQLRECGHFSTKCRPNYTKCKQEEEEESCYVHTASRDL